MTLESIHTFIKVEKQFFSIFLPFWEQKLVKYNFGIFIGVIYKNKQTNVKLKSSLYPYIQKNIAFIYTCTFIM